MQEILDIIKLVKSKPPKFFRFKKIRGQTTGYCDWDYIALDFRKDLVQTILHECTHYLYPELSESKVIKREKELMKVITNLQVAELLQIISRKIKYGEIHNFYQEEA